MVIAAHLKMVFVATTCPIATGGNPCPASMRAFNNTNLGIHNVLALNEYPLSDGMVSFKELIHCLRPDDKPAEAQVNDYGCGLSLRKNLCLLHMSSLVHIC